MIQYLIVCPLVFVAGLVDSIAGGGGLIALPAYLIAGVPAHMALGTNKMSSAMGTVVSTARFARNGYLRFGPWSPSGPDGVGGNHQAHDDSGAAHCGVLCFKE